jgi:hypothetical protein
MDAQPPRFLDQVRQCLRYKHYSLSTEKIYVYWMRFFIRWSGLRHPKEMGALEVEAFLTMLATERQVSPSTHRQALSAILFMYKEVLKVELPWLQEIGRPKNKQRLPVVLTALEIEQSFRHLDASNPMFALFAKLLYGTGMRIMEAARLRTKDIDFEHGAIVVRAGKGDKDRVVMLPVSLRSDLQVQLAHCKLIWQTDRDHQVAGVELPYALALCNAAIPPVATTYSAPFPGIDTSLRSFRLVHHFVFASMNYTFGVQTESTAFFCKLIIFLSSGTQDPQFVPHFKRVCKPASTSTGEPSSDSRAVLISVSATFKQLHTTLPRALKPCGALVLGMSNNRPNLATGS